MQGIFINQLESVGEAQLRQPNECLILSLTPKPQKRKKSSKISVMQFLFCSPSAQQQNTHFNKSECFMEGREEGISAKYHLVKRVSGCAGRRCVPGNDAQNTVSPILFGELKGINAALFFTASKINSCLQKLYRS